LRRKDEFASGEAALTLCNELRRLWHSECWHWKNPAFTDTTGKRSRVMLSQCANSLCAKPFLKLREGKLFLVETERLNKPGESAAPPFVRARQRQRQVEHYWLCDECATQFTLVYAQDRGISLAPLRRPAASVAAAVGRGRSGAA
jgi:hypothetical protein